TASSPCGNEDGTGAGTVVGSGAAIQCGRFRADRLDAGTVVTLTAALRAGQPLRALERSLPWRHVVLRPQGGGARDGGGRLRQDQAVSSPRCREWWFWAEARRASISAARCDASIRTSRSRSSSRGSSQRKSTPL